MKIDKKLSTKPPSLHAPLRRWGAQIPVNGRYRVVLPLQILDPPFVYSTIHS